MRSIAALSLLLSSTLAFAQGPVANPAPLAVLDAYHLSAATVQDLAWSVDDSVPHLEFTVTIAGQPETIRLLPYDVRSPNVEFWIEDATGLHRQPVSPSVTYRGAIVGRPASQVAAGVWDGGVRAMVWLDRTQPAWGIDPVQPIDPTVPVTRHVVYHSADIIATGTCGVTDGPFLGQVAGATGGTGGTGGFVDVLRVAEIAIECDRNYMSARANNTTTAQNDVTTVMNAVDLIYVRDVEITYTVSQIFFDVGTDPYTTTNGTTLLCQFSSYWRSNRASVNRDVAHLFSGRNFSGGTLGVAWLGTICVPVASTGDPGCPWAGGYGVSDHFSVTSTVSRTALVAHEVGHNWNADHCDATSGCRIMCSGLGGCGTPTAFGPSAVSRILAFKNTRSCLGNPAPPSLTSVTPNVVDALDPPTITLTGQNLDAVNEVRFVGVTLGTGQFQVMSSTQILVTPPEPLVIGPNFVWVVGSSSSNLLSFTYTAVDPADLVVPSLQVAGPLSPWLLEFGHQPGDAWALFMSPNQNVTVPILGIDFLVNSYQLASGVLPGSAVETWQWPLPAFELTGVTLFTQVVFIDSGFTTLTATPVRSSFVLN